MYIHPPDPALVFCFLGGWSFWQEGVVFVLEGIWVLLLGSRGELTLGVTMPQSFIFFSIKSIANYKLLVVYFNLTVCSLQMWTWKNTQGVSLMTQLLCALPVTHSGSENFHGGRHFCPTGEHTRKTGRPSTKIILLFNTSTKMIMVVIEVTISMIILIELSQSY